MLILRVGRAARRAANGLGTVTPPVVKPEGHAAATGAGRRSKRVREAGRYPMETPARISLSKACGVTPAIALKSAIK